MSLKNIFDIDLFGDDHEQTGGKEKLFIHKAPCVHKDDHEPYSLINPDVDKGPWIAGGACLRWFVGQPVSQDCDIDVFCNDEKQADMLVKRIKKYGRFTTMAKTENAVTLRYYSQEKDNNKSWLIQIIYCRFFPSLQQIIDSFDISVCQIGTDGYSWLHGKDTVKDIKNRRLRFTQPLRPDSMKRLLKYWTYGFQPVDGLIEEFQGCGHEWKLQDNEAYSNAF